MRKAGLLLLVLALCLVLGGWSGGEAYQMYLAASRQMDGAASQELRYHAVAQFDGGASEVVYNGKFQKLVTADGQVQMLSVMEIEEAGVPVVSSSYYKDGILYQEADGVRTARKAGVEQAYEEMDMSDVNYGQDEVLSGQVRETRTGRQVTLQLAPAVGNRVMASAEAADMELDTTAITHRITLDGNGVVDGYSVWMRCTFARLVEMEYQYNVEVSLNTLKRINFPADLDSYPVVD